MAAAAAELLRPETLSPANRASLADVHVYLVKAFMGMPTYGRLVDLGPAGMDKLRGVRPTPGPDK